MKVLRYALFAVLGALLAAVGFTVITWQFWALMAVTCAIRLVSLYEGSQQ